jgi:hypothetical protein
MDIYGIDPDPLDCHAPGDFGFGADNIMDSWLDYEMD